MKTMSIQRWQEASSSVLLKILPTPTSCKYEVLKENGFAKIKASKPSHWCEWYRARCPCATQILKKPTNPCQPLSALVNPCQQQEIHHKTRSWKVNSFSHPVLTANRFYINEIGSFISFFSRFKQKYVRGVPYWPLSFAMWLETCLPTEQLLTMWTWVGHLPPLWSKFSK